MLWDNPELEVVELTSSRRALALAFGRRGSLSDRLRDGLDQARFDLLEVDDLQACLDNIAARKPDVLLHDLVVSNAISDFRDQVDRSRATETLPVLPIMSRGEACPNALSLTPASNDGEIFLKLRALLRRERPSALCGRRESGCFQLDESGFKIHFQDLSAELSKTELCVLGPFFDLKTSKIDRQSLESLAFANNGWKTGSRSIDFHVIRMRKRVKAQIGIDPLCAIRGFGYALADG
tara:strand:- start:51494 stop:52204 length:711 start_codon:yes stop_codon:yes gene_type:complete